nr:flavodoxin domain-containing protein [uncultured Merdimonas sp.]
MGSGIIIYQSKYGATKKYVDWLQEKTGFEAVETKKARPDMISGKETVILCGGIYASGIAGISFLRKNRQALQGKKTAIFCVGASPYDGKAMEEIKAHNLKEDLKDIPVFYGRGAWNESAMTFPDRTMCKMLQKSVAKKDPSTYEPWMKALMCAVGEECDWTDPEYLEPLLKYLNGIQEEN